MHWRSVYIEERHELPNGEVDQLRAEMDRLRTAVRIGALDHEAIRRNERTTKKNSLRGSIMDGSTSSFWE